MEDVSPFLCPPEENKNPKWDEIEGGLTISAKTEVQISSLRKLIQYSVSGEKIPEAALMGVITNLSASKNHDVKKLLYLFYEICETRDRKGNLKPEFRLICDGIRKDLTHPNEYIRAAALRFMSRFHEKELINTLVPFVTKSLDHHNAYVRRHAVVAIGRIHQRWPEIAPDAQEDIAELLKTEKDPACMRVSFLVLCDISRDLAATFLNEILDESVLHLSQPMQLTAVTLIKSLCNDSRKGAYLPALIELLDSPSTAVKIEAAITLLNLSTSATASQTSFSVLCQIMQTIPNSTLQLSLAEQIERLIPAHPSIAQLMVGELIVAMKSKGIRATVLNMIKKLTNATNVKTIVQGLINHYKTQELLRQKENEAKDAYEFMALILTTLRSISSTYPATLSMIYDAVKTTLIENNLAISYESLMLVRDYMFANPDQADRVCIQIENILPFVQSPRILRGLSYLISLSTTRPESAEAIIGAYFAREKAALDPETEQSAPQTSTMIGSDGTYVTVEQSAAPSKSGSKHLIWFEKGINIFVGASLAMVLARICIRFPDQAPIEKCLGFIESILLRKNAVTQEKHLLLAHAAIFHRNDPEYKIALLDNVKHAFADIIDNDKKEFEDKSPKANQKIFTSPDQRLSFSSLLGRKFDQAGPAAANAKNASLKIQEETQEEKSKKSLVVLSGTCDPIFSECTMKPGKFDILLEINLLNQTLSNLLNVKVELYCSGKLELVDKPSTITLPAQQSDQIICSIKATSAEAGRIYGNILYDIENVEERQLIPLSPITITPDNYMTPLKVDSIKYREKWEMFEWEKKITISSTLSIKEIITRYQEKGKMHLMNEFDDNASWATVNLCATSMFDEDVLLNISLEKTDNGTTEGYMRLRCASQPMAIAFSRLLMSINLNQ